MSESAELFLGHIEVRTTRNIDLIKAYKTNIYLLVRAYYAAHLC